MEEFQAHQVWNGEKWIDCDKVINVIDDEMDVYYSRDHILVFGKNKEDNNKSCYKCSLEVKIDATIVESK